MGDDSAEERGRGRGSRRADVQVPAHKTAVVVVEHECVPPEQRLERGRRVRQIERARCALPWGTTGWEPVSTAASRSARGGTWMTASGRTKAPLTQAVHDET